MSRWKKIGGDGDWKDGRHVLVADDVAVSEARYVAESSGWWLANTDPTDQHDGQIFPTYWRPMPSPPTAR